MIGWIGYTHLFLFGLLLPLVAIRRARMLTFGQYPPRRKLFASIVMQHSLFIIFSLLVARVEWIELFAPPAKPMTALLLAMVVLAAFIAFMYPRWKRNVINREPKIYLFMPQGTSEKSLWIVISALAGFGEELIYRGVLWELLERLTGSLPMATLLAAIAFAAGHYYQGWKSTAVIFVFSLLFHALVWLTGSLIPAMLVHFLYDAAAGMMYSYYGEKFGYPPEGIPASAD